MRNNFFGRKPEAMLDFGGKRSVVGEDFCDGRSEVTNPRIDKANNETRILIIFVHELRNIELIIIASEQRKMIFCPTKSKFIVNKMEALDFGLDDEARENEVDFKGAMSLN